MLARIAAATLLFALPALVLAGEPRIHPRETFDVDAARAALTPEQLASKRDFVEAFAEAVATWDGKFCPDKLSSLPLDKTPWPDRLNTAFWGVNAGWHIGYLPAIRCHLRIQALREEMGIADAVQNALATDLPFDTESQIPGYQPPPPIARNYSDLYYAWLWGAKVDDQLDEVASRVLSEHGVERAAISARVAISRWEDLVLGGVYEAHERLNRSQGVQGHGP